MSSSTDLDERTLAMQAAYDAGTSVAQLATEYGISTTRVYKIILTRRRKRTTQPLSTHRAPGIGVVGYDKCDATECLVSIARAVAVGPEVTYRCRVHAAELIATAPGAWFAPGSGPPVRSIGGDGQRVVRY